MDRPTVTNGVVNSIFVEEQDDDIRMSYIRLGHMSMRGLIDLYKKGIVERHQRINIRFLKVLCHEEEHGQLQL